MDARLKLLKMVQQNPDALRCLETASAAIIVLAEIMDSMNIGQQLIDEYSNSDEEFHSVHELVIMDAICFWSAE